MSKLVPPAPTRLVALATALALLAPPAVAGSFQIVPTREWNERERALSEPKEVRVEPSYAGTVLLTASETAAHAEIVVTGTAVTVLAQDWKTWKAHEFDRPMTALAGAAWVGGGVGLGAFFEDKVNDEGEPLALGG